QQLFQAEGRDPDILLLVTPHDIVEVTGPVAWRFFSWGICKGGGAMTRFKHFLMHTFGASEPTANRMDVTNPTPFMLLLWLLILALVSRLVPHKRQEQLAVNDQACSDAQ